MSRDAPPYWHSYTEVAPGESEGGYSPPPRWSMLAPGRKVKSDFFGDFWHLQYPENHILAPSSEESATPSEIPGATPAHTLYIIELDVDFETNIDLNLQRKHDECLQLTHELSSMYCCVRLINLSISSLGIFGNSCKSFTEMCNDLDVEKQHMMHVLRKTTYIIIRSTFYIFCMRNKPWTNPDLLVY